MRLRDIATVSCPDGPRRVAGRRRAPRRQLVASRYWTSIPVAVFAVAKELAGGDLGRLLLHHDGAVSVMNSREHRDRALARRT